MSDDEEVDIESPFVHVWDERDDLPPFFKIAIALGLFLGVVIDRYLLDPIVAWILSFPTVAEIGEIGLSLVTGIFVWFFSPSIVPADLLFLIIIIWIIATVVSPRRF